MAEPNSSTSSFKRFLVRILLPLVLIISVAGIVFDYFFEKKIILSSELCGAYKVNRILTETHANEIPIFGSSRAEGGFIPDSLGNNYFNYGLSGTKYDVTLFFIEEECKKAKNVPWIILDLDLEGLSYGLGDIANYMPNSSYAAVQQLLGSDNKLYYRVPFVKYYGRFETYFRNYLNNRIQLTKFSNKGAALEKNVMPQKEFEALVAERKNTTTTFTTDSLLKAKLLGFITSYTNRTFIFVIPPYHSSYFEKYTNPEDAYSFISMLRSYRNVKVVDISKFPLPDDMFLNTSHVNYKGAIAFNRALKDSLITIGVH